MLEDIDEPFFAVNEKRIVTEINPASERMLKAKAEDLVGRSFYEAWPAVEQTVFEEKFQKALRTHRTVSFAAKPYTVRVIPDGSSVMLLCRRTEAAPKEEGA